jgi:integrase
LGERRLDQITSHDVQRLYADMDARGLAARTIRYTHSVLKQALKRAVIQGALVRNPADHAELPRQKRREMKVLAPQEVNRFLVVTRDDPLHALWAILLLGGLRPGEALGLRWSDLDGTQICIVRALRKTTGDQYILADTKTDGSRRTVLLPARAVSALQSHRTKQSREILAAGPDYERNDLVFANACGRPMDIAKVRRCFKAALKKAGLKQVRLYDARHTHATVLMGEGVNPKVVSERLGHTNVGITLDTYSHVLPTMQQSVVERLDTLFKVASG